MSGFQDSCRRWWPDFGRTLLIAAVLVGLLAAAAGVGLGQHHLRAGYCALRYLRSGDPRDQTWLVELLETKPRSMPVIAAVCRAGNAPNGAFNLSWQLADRLDTSELLELIRRNGTGGLEEQALVEHLCAATTPEVRWLWECRPLPVRLPAEAVVTMRREDLGPAVAALAAGGEGKSLAIIGETRTGLFGQVQVPVIRYAVGEYEVEVVAESHVELSRRPDGTADVGVHSPAWLVRTVARESPGGGKEAVERPCFEQKRYGLFRVTHVGTVPADSPLATRVRQAGTAD